MAHGTEACFKKGQDFGSRLRSNKYHIVHSKTNTQMSSVVTHWGHSVYDLMTKSTLSRKQQRQLGAFNTSALNVGQAGVISLAKIRVFTYLNGEWDRVTDRPAWW